MPFSKAGLCLLFPEISHLTGLEVRSRQGAGAGRGRQGALDVLHRVPAAPPAVQAPGLTACASGAHAGPPAVTAPAGGRLCRLIPILQPERHLEKQRVHRARSDLSQSHPKGHRTPSSPIRWCGLLIAVITTRASQSAASKLKDARHRVSSQKDPRRSTDVKRRSENYFVIRPQDFPLEAISPSRELPPTWCSLVREAECLLKPCHRKEALEVLAPSSLPREDA